MPQPEFRHLQPQPLGDLDPPPSSAPEQQRDGKRVPSPLPVPLSPPWAPCGRHHHLSVCLLGKGLEEPQPLCQEPQTSLRKGHFHHQNGSTLPVRPQRSPGPDAARFTRCPSCPQLLRAKDTQPLPVHNTREQIPGRLRSTPVLPDCQSPARAKSPASLAEFCKRRVLGVFCFPLQPPESQLGLG